MAGVFRVATAAILSLVLLIVYVPTVPTSPAQVARDRQLSGAKASGEVKPGQLGAVASESVLCSRHGTDMLERGGNAADAVSVLAVSLESAL